MPAEELQRLGLVPEFDFVEELRLPVPTGEVSLDDLDRRNARGQVVGQRVNRLQVSVLVVELANVGEREARDRVDRVVGGPLGADLSGLLSRRQGRRNVSFC